MVCEIRPNNEHKIAVIVCYKPPNQDARHFTESIDGVLGTVCKTYQDMIVIGDFNMPHIDWLLPDNISRFVEVMNSYGLMQLNRVPSTIHGNIPDLVFSNHIELFKDNSKLPCNFRTDHEVLKCNLNTTKPKTAQVRRTVFNYKAADFASLQVTVNSASVDKAWSDSLELVMSAVDKHVPKTTIKDSAAPQWFDSK